MTAREEMARFGFCQDQKPHPIFARLSKLRNTECPSRKIEKEIERIEREIEQSMADSIAEQAARDYETPLLE